MSLEKARNPIRLAAMDMAEAHNRSNEDLSNEELIELVEILDTVRDRIGESISEIEKSQSKKQKKISESHDQDLRDFRKKGENFGFAVAAATIDHIFENGEEFEDIKERVLAITGR